MSLDAAIAKMEEYIASYGQGTPTQPREGTMEGFLLRGFAIGLSHLRQVKAEGLGDRPIEAERHYKESLAATKRVSATFKK